MSRTKILATESIVLSNSTKYEPYVQLSVARAKIGIEDTKEPQEKWHVNHYGVLPSPYEAWSAISGMRTKSLYTGFGKHGASTQKLWVKQPDYWSGHEVYSSKNQISTN